MTRTSPFTRLWRSFLEASEAAVAFNYAAPWRAR